MFQGHSRTRDYPIATALLVATFLIFWFSPVHQVTDSNYSMLLSDCLLRRQTFALDRCNLPILEPKLLGNFMSNGGIYQLELVRNHVYYFFPVGSSVLSIPYVAAASVFGVSPRNADGTFNPRGEREIQITLAALLMALATALFFLMGRFILPTTWSLLLALAGSLGTQIWSTASRGLWSHTWSTLLATVLLYLLVSKEVGRHQPRPVLIATLLSWMYFVRPTNSLVILAVTLFILVCYRKIFWPYLATGMVWLSAFLFYSWHNFGRLFPKYYRADRLLFDIFPTALRGNLISPSRGLLVFVPVVLFVAFLLIRYWKHRPLPRLTWLALFVVFATLIIISGFAHWWGGASFGPRFSTDAVPWFVLLGAIGIKAMLNWRRQNHPGRLRLVFEMSVGAILLAASIFVNARGALVIDTWRWNPDDVSQLGNKLWDWRQPQFLAGLVAPPLDREYPPIAIGTEIDFTRPEQSSKYLWYGWSTAEDRFRWTEGREASIVFALDHNEALILRMKVVPFIREGLWNRQRIFVSLNGAFIDSLILTENEDFEFSISLQENLLRRENVLKLRIPDATSPELLKISTDQRLLGLGVYWIKLEHKR